MKKKKEVLAIIPARGGSKGIPRKNIVDLCGQPLIAYTINVALKSSLIDRVLVSTEDEEIAEISIGLGAEVPFLRPSEMAGDHSSIAEAANFTIRNLRKTGYFADTIVYLYPTHPFRSVKLIDSLIEKALEGYASVQTVKKIIYSGCGPFIQGKDSRLIPIFSGRNKAYQDRVFFRPYGVFQAIKSSGGRRGYLHTLDDPISLIDIDTFDDLKIAREIIRSNRFNFDE